ncbi:MAG: radical SAM protein, partial [Oscillospiraceae bacterium]
RFRLTPEEIINLAIEAHNVGYKTIVLQSGEDAFYTTKILSEIVKEIKKTGLFVTLSCGEMSYKDYEILKESGTDRYLLKHETSNEILYKKLHPDSDFKTRKKCLKNLKEIGFETGGGFMIGLPEQTLLDIANDLLLLKEIGCDMAGIGPFISHPDTQLKACPCGDTDLTLRVVALARILLPNLNLPATTSLGVLEKDKKNEIFSTGANVIMQKITPNNFKELYQIYPAEFDDFSITDGRKNIEKQIIALSKIPV